MTSSEDGWRVYTRIEARDRHARSNPICYAPQVVHEVNGRLLYPTSLWSTLALLLDVVCLSFFSVCYGETFIFMHISFVGF